MSLGSIVGGVVGGAIGFFVGGPIGAFYGASLGFGVGMMIDPITPDIPSTGDPNPESQMMSGEVGTPIKDLCGTAKIPGHLLCFGNERNTAVTQKTGGGGKGGGGDSQTQVIGYKYYMSWAVGICACPDTPVDVLYAIYKNDDAEPVWHNESGLELPVSGGQETIVIDGVGSMVFSFGTDDQAAIPAVGDIISDSTLNTPYRKLCWAFFDDCYIGEYNRTPTYKFIIKKTPSIAAIPTGAEIQGFDCNPAHAIYYIFNVLAGLPISWLNTDDFASVADTLALESRGVCLLLDSQQSALSYLESINNHVDNIIRYGSDGQFHPKLIRNDYDSVSLPLIDESVMLDDPDFNRGSWIDTVNEVKVQYNELINVDTGIYDIFGLAYSGAELYGVRFDGNTLYELGAYDSPDQLSCLVIYNGNLLTVSGSGASASLRQVSSTPSDGLLPFISDTDSFNAYDIVTSDAGRLIKDSAGKLWYTGSGRLIRLSENLEKEKRYFTGTVTTGTDGELYSHSIWADGWPDSWRPITGVNWSSAWDLVGDHENDGVTTAWGTGVISPNASQNPFITEHEGYIYNCFPHSYGKIRRYDSNGVILNDVDSSLSYATVGYKETIMTTVHDYIFAHSGVFGSSEIKRYNATTLDYIDSVTLTTGRAQESNNLLIVGGKLIVLTGIYSSGDQGVYKINPVTMAIEDFANLGSDYIWKTIAYINSTFVAVGGNTDVGVFNLETMEMVDAIPFPVTGGGTVYNTTELTVKAV